MDLRVAPAELADGARHEGVEGRRVDHADAKAPDIAARHPLSAFHRRIGRGHDVAGILEEGVAGFGQLHAARQSPEERRAELVLQRADLLRQRRLADAQPLGGAREVAGLGDREKVAQVPQFHI